MFYLICTLASTNPWNVTQNVGLRFFSLSHNRVVLISSLFTKYYLLAVLQAKCLTLVRLKGRKQVWGERRYVTFLTGRQPREFQVSLRPFRRANIFLTRFRNDNREFKKLLRRRRGDAEDNVDLKINLYFTYASWDTLKSLTLFITVKAIAKLNLRNRDIEIEF